MAETRTTRVFVSHHHSPDEDAFTARLVSDLSAAGADVWVDDQGITSDDFVQKISEGLAGRQWLVLVMTPESVASPWVRREVNTALNEQTAGRMLGVIPFVMRRTREEDIPMLWRALHRYDATRGYEPERDRLFRAMGLVPAAVPATPVSAPPVIVQAPAQAAPPPMKPPTPAPSQPPRPAPKPSQPRRISARTGGVFAAGVVGVALVALLVSQLPHLTGNHGSPSATSTTGVTCPLPSTQASWHLVTPGKLTIATDATYAPAEYQDPANPNFYLGYDMELARELARRLCLTPVIVQASFGSIITDISQPPLGQQRYDMSISAFTINTQRVQRVAMIPYFTAGESLLVAKGNPANLTSDFTSLCGKTIAAQDGTTELMELQDLNGGNNGTGHPAACRNKPIKILHFSDQSVVVQQVISGSAVASYQDSEVTGYDAAQNASKVEPGPLMTPLAPQGIVVRRDNSELKIAIDNALSAMRADGTYKSVLRKWGQLSGAYPPLS